MAEMFALETWIFLPSAMLIDEDLQSSASVWESIYGEDFDKRQFYRRTEITKNFIWRLHANLEHPLFMLPMDK